MNDLIDFKGIIARAGKWTLVLDIVALALAYWKIFNIGQYPLAMDIMYVYLVINGAAATPFYFLERRKVKPKVCPQCDTPLKVQTSYHCAKCGEFQFKKQEPQNDRA